MKKILLALALALALPAQAQVAVSGSAADAAAGANSASGSNAGASVIVNNPAVPSSTHNKLDYQGHYEVKTVPNVIVPNILPSAVCHGTTSAGVSVLGFGVGGGSSWQDHDCQYRETARVFHAMGMGTDAVAVLCSSGFAANAPTCKAMPKPTPTADVGTKVGEPGQPGGGDRVRADAEFCKRAEVQADAILAERNGCAIAVATAIKRSGPR